MCGKKWWERNDEGWWKPLRKESRPWESTEAKADGSFHREVTLEHTSSPFRTVSDPPPNISWVHPWGMMKWGKKAGNWGLGTKGLNKEPENTQSDKKDSPKKE